MNKPLFAPPVDKNGSSLVVTTPGGPGPSVGLPFCFAFVNQFARPAGWWVRSPVVGDCLSHHLRRNYRG